MKTVYMHQETRSIADLTHVNQWLDDSRNLWEVNRISVLPTHRGRGLGSKMLREIVADADLEGVELVLDILPSGALNGDELADWYRRYGFEWTNDPNWWMMRRLPRITKEES